MASLVSAQDKPRAPRHRHSAVQLAALNSVYEQTAHPTLSQRTALAQSLGLEIKAVSSFYQNKRASSKKQARGGPYDPPSMPPSHHPRPYGPIEDDYYYPPADGALQHFRSQALRLDQDPRNQYPPGDHTQFLSDVMGSGRLSRPQIDELQRIYRMNSYPTTEDTQIIAERIGTRYQYISEWFRTQRSLDRRPRTDGYPPASISPLSEEADFHSRAYLTLPPLIGLPPASSHPSLVGIESERRLSSIPEDPPYNPRSSRRSSSPRNATPYGSTSTVVSLSARQRRGRPDSVQLDGLRRLLSKTPTPSIEERSALALEIGMDLGKVTNWFRNLRQSTRKREKRVGRHAGSDDESEYNEPVYLSSTSRSASASRSETPSVEHESEYARGRRRKVHSSDDEEEAQEAVTPSSSPSPGRGRSPDLMQLDEKAVAQFSGRVPYEDAMLLLAFHRRAGMF
ncbi:homeodomain transcription factor [Mycena vulgaris]|nr:homeodomain transcription factor [Mycena vulgaris]